MTPKQQAVLQFVDTFIAEKSIAPSYREIKQHFGFRSLSSVHKYVQILKNKGMLLQTEGTIRSLSIPSAASSTDQVTTIPFLGLLHSGSLIEPISSTDSIDIPSSLISTNAPCFCVRIHGISLHHLQIDDGDLLILQKKEKIESGERVLLSIDERPFISDYFPEGQHIRLKNYSSSGEERIVHPHEVIIKGSIIALFRIYH